jgi:hypothetical protein
VGATSNNAFIYKKWLFDRNSLKSIPEKNPPTPAHELKKRNRTPLETALLVLGDYENTPVSQN